MAIFKFISRSSVFAVSKNNMRKKSLSPDKRGWYFFWIICFAYLHIQTRLRCEIMSFKAEYITANIQLGNILLFTIKGINFIHNIFTLCYIKQSIMVWIKKNDYFIENFHGSFIKFQILKIFETSHLFWCSKNKINDFSADRCLYRIKITDVR